MSFLQGIARWKIVGALFLGVLLIWFLSGVFVSEEGKIKKRIKLAATAIEEEDFIAFIGVFSKQYQDPFGLTLPAMMKIAQLAFTRFEDIKVDLSNIDIEIDGDKATATLSVWGEATRASTMGTENLPSREAFEDRGVTLYFEKQGSKWLIVSSQRMAWESAINL